MHVFVRLLECFHDMSASFSQGEQTKRENRDTTKIQHLY